MTPNLMWIIAPLALVTIAFVWLWRRAVRVHRAEVERLEKRRTAAESAYQRVSEDARVAADEAASAAIKSAMRTLQQLAAGQASQLEKLQDKHGADPDVLQDLLDIDHTNAQIGRRAQAIATLCGGFLGRRREAKLYDVLRGAVSRIENYRRVSLRDDSDIGVVGQAVEPLAMVIAELLDNATSHSPPDTTVYVSTSRVAHGVVVMVDDGGVGMEQEKRERAANLLSGNRPIGITDLGNPPQFGFPVIGVLAQRHRFTVSVDHRSDWGGVRAVAMLPKELLTTVAEPEPYAPAVPADASEGSATEPPQRPAAATAGTTAGGLPKRRRAAQATPLPQEEAVPHQPHRSDASDDSARDTATASAMGAFQRGTHSGRSGNEHEEGPHQ